MTGAESLESDDPAARVDALVASIGPRLGTPAVTRRDVVLVTGPWMAGVTGVVSALRQRLPQHKFVESPELGPGDAPALVVFVVSAAAELTGSDCALLDAAAEQTDAVIGVVSKIDVHRVWRDVLAANCQTLAAHAPRYGRVLWVGVAAQPDLGDPIIDDLAETVSTQLADPDIARRNRLRAWDSRLQTVANRIERDADGAGRRARVDALRAERSTALRERRQAKSERTINLREQIQQARIQLAHFARNRCSSLRSELQQDAAGLSRRDIAGFEEHVRTRAADVVEEVGEGATAQLREVTGAMGVQPAQPAAEQLPAVAVASPPLKSRRLENRLVVLLGGGFGLGVALTLSKLLAGMAHSLNPWLVAAGGAVCVLVGLALTFAVVNMRSLLADRALLDRWTGDVASSVRSVTEELVATRVLATESMLSTELSAREEVENTQVGDRVGVIDSELREHAIAAARAAAVLDREMPTVRAALDAVRAELGEPDVEQPDVEQSDPETGSAPDERK